MKAKDLRERSQDDLKELEKSLAKDVFQARFKNFTNRLDDTSSIKKTKKDLARVKTLLAEAAKGIKHGEPKAKKAKAPKAAAKPAAAAKKAAAPKKTKKEAK
jgi:large subunit ribosomal protein L29